MERYFGLFANWQDIMQQFQVFGEPNWRVETFPYTSEMHLMVAAIKQHVPQDPDILFAIYTDLNYSGRAFVVYTQDGKLYEVHGSHCSCNGLEEQWAPEETSWEALRMRTAWDDFDATVGAGEAWNALIAAAPVA